MAAIIRGLIASLAIGIGYLPIAFSFGLSAVQAGLSPLLGILISVVLFAGGSQFVLIGLIAAGNSLLGIVPTVLLMNARHLLYGASLRGFLPSRKLKLPTPFLAFGLTDEVFANAMAKLPQVAETDREYWLFGLQLGAYLAWIGGTVLGVLVDTKALDAYPLINQALQFVLPALFFTLLLNFNWRQQLSPLIVSASVVVILFFLIPAYLAIPIGIVSGAGYAVFRGDRDG